MLLTNAIEMAIPKIMKHEPPAKKPRVNVQFRLSSEEKAILEAATAQEHLKLGTWLRRMALKNAEKILAHREKTS